MAKKIIGCFFFVLIIIFAASDAASAGDLKGALVGGKPTLDLRYRFEGVGQEGMDKDAAASTLRLRLGYTTKEFNGFSLHVDVENIQVIGKDSYNSTDNGKVDYPVVADPADSELNQVYVKYAGISNTILTLGRQRIKIGNDRFIGNVGWRQNEQTYDAIRLVNRSVSHLTITLAHIMNVNRIFGQHHSSNGDLDMNTNVIHLDYDFSFGRLSAYGYFMDNRDAPQLSHQTIGLRFSGAQTISRPLKVLYSLEYSVQDEYKDGRDISGAAYRLLELGLAWNKLTLKGGYEVLGSKGTVGFSTPLATLHAFNGWADKFLSTPQNGLVDLSLQLGYTQTINGQPLVFRAVYHKFDSDFAGFSYGSEIDLLLQYKTCEYTTLFLKYAGYNANQWATDTTKIWAGFQFSF